MENVNQIYWEEKLAEWKSSGQELRTWCKEHQIDVKKFNYWKSRLNVTGGNDPSPIFAEVSLSNTQESRPAGNTSHGTQIDNRLTLYCQGMRISIPDGFHPDTLLSLLRTLKRL